MAYVLLRNQHLSVISLRAHPLTLFHKRRLLHIGFLKAARRMSPSCGPSRGVVASLNERQVLEAAIGGLNDRY